MHKSITLERVVRVIEDDQHHLSSSGFCLSCGVRADSVEPDAREYPCEICGERQVFGAEEILLSCLF